jgi:hypothetical protein
VDECWQFLLFFFIFLALGLFACTSGSTLPIAPDIPADAWNRDPAPIITAGARVDDLLDIAVADPDVVYDMETGVWHLWY